MMLYENTRTVYDLVHNAAAEHGDRVFLQYEENGIIFRVTYKEFACECDAIAAWAREKRAQVGHKLKDWYSGSQQFIIIWPYCLA